MSHDDHPTTASVSLDFHHQTSAAHAAREAVAPLLREDGTFADDVELATSEMVTNVIQHTDDGGRLSAWDDDPLVIEVEDFDNTLPAIPSHATEQGGRGLSIVKRLADQWGVTPTRTGKVVWAKFKRPPKRGPDHAV